MPTNTLSPPLLDVHDLCVSFTSRGQVIPIVENLSFSIGEQEILGLVGESGSGKSVTAMALMGLIDAPGVHVSGSARFKGQELLGLSGKQMRALRGREIAMIFQDPMTSLDPTMPIGKQVAESLMKHNKISKKEGLRQALELLNLVGIPNAEKRLKNYPHQFSGGQRQRIVIAIALICYPQILIADEPTTALDVTIQAQILELLKDIQKKINSSIVFITHDLGVVANVADRVAVMYGGKIVEVGTAEEIFYNPQHPYTWGLLGSMPTLEGTGDRLYAIPGSPPDLLDPPTGDAFYPRNEFALQIDAEQQPPLVDV